MRGCVIFRWGLPHPGREPEGMDFAMRSQAVMEGWHNEGLITSWRWVTSPGGEEDDMFLAEAEVERIPDILARPEFAATVAEGRFLMTRFRVETGMTGRAEEVYADWAAMLERTLGAPAG